MSKLMNRTKTLLQRKRDPGDVINTHAGAEHWVKKVRDEPLVLQASLIKTN